VSTAPFRHIGGMVLADHGPLTLAEAHALTAFYRREGRELGRTGRPDLARLCQTRGRALLRAIRRASRWRRAAGWVDTDGPDRLAAVRRAWPS
jgi:hypothetical protein